MLVTKPVPSLTALPTPDPANPPVPRASIDLHSALLSAVRAWLASRDSILWTFCSGTADDVLDHVSLADAIEISHRMNEIRGIAVGFATQLADRTHTPYTVLRSAVDELLAAETPKCLLTTDSAPGSF